MRILRPLALLLLSLLSFSAKSQTETVMKQERKLQQLYLSLGVGGSFINSTNMASTGANASLHLTAALPKNKLVRGGLFSSSFADTQPASQKWKEDNHRINMVPEHFIGSYFLTAGKRKQFDKFLQFQAFAGLSYTKYEEPISVHQRTADFGFFGTYQVLGYEVKTHHKPGIILQAEAMFLPLRFAGLTLGGYYHFVPKISNGGFTISLNLGRIRIKEIL
ncbi:hypothetical protein I5M27_04340 [Adhaeribacter sp. BT258]|uniref:Outer membrane protein beta-barrel domain-containing protein n=1 Tax=Adhaeribacter terrigena TaxID=2793070 RepID=A0ABS1BYG9_9BACT|nr:hypothetical protein [Adhaeribacter terrigena]MBK0402199.1 hypothetical protein [Adhaeribacter terrigena]